MSIYDAPVKPLHGAPASLADYKGEALLIVNVASKCGNTPQYTQLEELQKKYEGRGFSVLGFPEKIDVNGPDRSPLYAELTEQADASGKAGEVRWNFEKFLVSPGGEVVARFRGKVLPDAEQVVEAIEAQLPR